MKRVFLILLFSLCHFSYACTLKVRFENYDKETQFGAPLVWHGLDVDFAKALLDSANCKYRFVNVPWARAMDMMKTGQLDLMLSISNRPERAKYMHFIGPQREETIIVAMNQAKPLKLATLSDLVSTPKPVAVHRGAFYGDAFSELLRSDKNKAHFLSVSDNWHKIEMLKQGRISGFLAEKHNVMYQKMHNSMFDNVVFSPLVINSESVYFALSKKSVDERLLTRLQKAFESAEYEQRKQLILDKYQLE